MYVIYKFTFQFCVWSNLYGKMALTQIKYHQNNYIDENFKKALFPLNLLQNIYFVSKYTIRNNFIHTKSYIYIFFSILSACLIIFAFFSHMELERDFVKVLSISIYYSLIVDHFIYIFECLILFLDSFKNSKLHIELILNVQKIMKIFKKSDNDFKRWHIVNWIIFFTIFVSYFVISVLFASRIDNIWSNHTLRHVFYMFALLYYDVNIICAYRYMNIINKCIKLCICNIQRFSKRYIENSNPTKYIGIDHKTYFSIYIDIIDSFDKFKNMFQLSVSIKKIVRKSLISIKQFFLSASRCIPRTAE